MLLGVVGVALAGPSGSILEQTPDTQGLQKAGPINPENGFPDWYKDKSGTALEPCLEPKNPMCIIGNVPNVDAPVKFTENFPDEFFYYALSSAIDDVGTPDANGRFGSASVEFAIEGAFANELPAQGDQMVFARFRTRITQGVTPGADYTLVHPYGETKVHADEDSLFVTEDVGITPGNFTDALNGRTGPFLKWTDQAPGEDPLPEGFLGDPTVDHEVTGSPVDQNYFAILGPGIGVGVAEANKCGEELLARVGGNADNCAVTNLFSLMGKEATRGGVDVHRAVYSRAQDPATPATIDVLAESKAGENIVLQDPDAARRATTDRLFPTTTLEQEDGNYVAHVTAKTSDVPETLEVVNYSDVPKTVAKPTLIDAVTGSATYDTDTDTLTVEAVSSDKQLNGGSPAVKVTLPELDDAELALVADDPNSKRMVAIGSMTAPPATVKVTSTGGGEITLPVDLTGASTAPSPLLANAGKDFKVQPGQQNVALNGSNSSGNVATFKWTGPYAIVTDQATGAKSLGELLPEDPANGSISNDDLEVANLTAPDNEGEYGYRLTITGDGNGTGDQLTDDVIVTVQNQATVIDTFAIATARYRTAQLRWIVDGTSSVRDGSNEVTVYNGPTASGDVIGTAVVDRLGNWALDVRDSDITPMACAPGATTACVSARSTYNGLQEAFVVTLDNVAPVLQQPPAADPVAPDAGTAGTAGAAAPAVAGLAAPAAARAPLAAAVPLAGATAAAARVTAPAVFTAAAVGTTGVPVTVAVPTGATLVRLRVLTTAGKPLFSTFQKVKGGTKVKMRIRSAKLRRQLRAGKRYVIEVRAGTARGRLGKATRKVLRIRH
jgi:hypothetical protein